MCSKELNGVPQLLRESLNIGITEDICSSTVHIPLHLHREGWDWKEPKIDRGRILVRSPVTWIRRHANIVRAAVGLKLLPRKPVHGWTLRAPTKEQVDDVDNL